jgi:transcriptional regulator with XRE-family HTH domain
MSLRTIRRARDITQIQLEELSGVDQGTISDIECGRNTNPNWKTLKRLASALGVAPQDLIPQSTDEVGAA